MVIIQKNMYLNYLKNTQIIKIKGETKRKVIFNEF